MLVIKTALKVECWVLHNLFSFYGFFTLSLYTTHSTRSTNRVLFSRTLFVLVVPCILISVPVVVWLKKVQIGPKRSKKSLINVITSTVPEYAKVIFPRLIISESQSSARDTGC